VRSPSTKVWKSRIMSDNFHTIVSALRSLAVCQIITSSYSCAVSHAAMDDSIAEASSAGVIVSKPGRLQRSSCRRRMRLAT